MKNIFVLIVLLVLGTSAQAELVCEGNAYGLDLIYTFNKNNSRNLSLDKKTYMKGSVFDEASGTAKYSSTVKSRLMKDSTAESYYVFVRGEGSFTELIGISHDLKSMARSRPDPTSDNGNYIKFMCKGSL